MAETRFRKSGWCGSGTHDRCGLVAVNGQRAKDRYALCSCDCHYPLGDTGLGVIASVMGHWGVEGPSDGTFDVVSSHVRQVNGKIEPALEDAS